MFCLIFHLKKSGKDIFYLCDLCVLEQSGRENPNRANLLAQKNLDLQLSRKFNGTINLKNDSLKRLYFI